MAEILRSWRCLNARCSKTFDAWEPNPACPKCGCVRVDWVPGGGHLGGTAAGADAELRTLADIFKMGDMNSAERGRQAKKIAPAAPAGNGPLMNFAPGFAAPAPSSNQAACLPTAAGVDFKAKVGIGNKLAPSRVFPNVSRNTVVDASHRPPS